MKKLLLALLMVGGVAQAYSMGDIMYGGYDDMVAKPGRLADSGRMKAAIREHAKAIVHDARITGGKQPTLAQVEQVEKAIKKSGLFGM